MPSRNRSGISPRRSPFTNPHPFYDSPLAAEVYAHPSLSHLDTGERQAIRQYIRPDSRVLVLGCGGGREATAIARLNHRVIGVDRSASLVRRARASTIDAAPKARRVTWVVADASGLPFKPGSFDSATLLTGLLGLIRGRQNRVESLRETRRVLIPTGRAIVHLGAMPIVSIDGLSLPLFIKRPILAGLMAIFYPLELIARSYRGLQPPSSRATEPGDLELSSDENTFFHRYTNSEFRLDLNAAGLLSEAVLDFRGRKEPRPYRFKYDLIGGSWLHVVAPKRLDSRRERG